MAPKRKILAQDVTTADSDDEGPEEVAMSSGKVMAYSQRNQERQTRSAALEQRKTRNKATEERNIQQKRSKSDREVASILGITNTPLEEGDFLPDSVLAAVQDRKAQARLVSIDLKLDKNGKSGTQRKRLETTKKGPVTVQVLSAARRLAAARNNFREEKLKAVKRSHDMLRPPCMGRIGPAAKFC